MPLSFSQWAESIYRYLVKLNKISKDKDIELLLTFKKGEEIVRINKVNNLWRQARGGEPIFTYAVPFHIWAKAVTEYAVSEEIYFKNHIPNSPVTIKGLRLNGTPEWKFDYTSFNPSNFENKSYEKLKIVPKSTLTVEDEIK